MRIDPFPFNALYESLRTINRIKFTPREIDIIACVVSGRRRKTTASFLSIADKTVETHLRKIMLKLDCSSQEDIREFLEKSNKFNEVKQHYLHLSRENLFKRSLQKISSLTDSESSQNILIYWDEQQDSFIQHLRKHFKEVGLKTSILHRDSKAKLTQEIELQKKNVFYLFPESPHAYPLTKNDVSTLFQHVKNLGKVIFLVPGKEVGFLKEKEPLIFLYLNNYNDYYFLFFDVLQHILSHPQLEAVREDFTHQSEILIGKDKLCHQVDHSLLETVPQNSQDKILKKDTWVSLLHFFKNVQTRVFKRGLFLLALVAVILFIYKLSPFNLNHKVVLSSSIQSDLPLPEESVFLDRSHIIREIEIKLKGDETIRAIALVGVGGAGKTALARQYARQQNIPLIWEINAESSQHLQESFENLARALSKTEEDNKLLKEVQNIKNTLKREEKILEFVKEHLKAQKNWLLIYDNVNNFSEIQHHFPKDLHTWGKGKVILTTQNSNIQNNKYIKNVILVDTLDDNQKLSLFVNIMKQGKEKSSTPLQEKEIKRFLEEIPSFPLDVSLAAYYLKATNVPYENYLKDLIQYDKDFINVQQNILQESGDYNKTRYSIIILSLEQLIKSHQDFEALLLLISLLDSQDIPRDLLSVSKGDSIVDNFIYNLEKYSFITNQPTPSSLIVTLSLHRSVPKVILDYLTKSLKSDKKNQLLEETSNALAKYMACAVKEENIVKMRLLARHGDTFLKHENLLTLEARTSLGGELGTVHFYLGDYIKAEQLLKERLPFLKDNTLKMAKVLDQIGVIHKELGNYEDARKALEESLALYETTHPEHYRETAHTLTHLGNIYKELGDEAKAQQAFEKSLPLYEKGLTSNEKDNIWTFVHWGIVYKGLGNYQKAISSFEKSLSIYQTYFPDNYVRIAWVLANLGSIYNSAKDYIKARDVLEQSLTIYKKHFSENHNGFAFAASLLGKTYQFLGNYKEAKNLFQKSMAAYSTYYGKDHIEVGRILRNLAHIYLLENQREMSKKLLQQARDIFLKKNHPESKLVLEDLKS